MAHLPGDNEAQPDSTTSSFIQGPIKIVIDWEIPNLSTLKERTAELESNAAVVGTSAWSILLYPLGDTDFTEDNTVDGTEPLDAAADTGPVMEVYLKHECLGNDVSDIKAFFELSLKDDAGLWYTILEKNSEPDTFVGVVHRWGNADIRHAELWGPGPKYNLKNGTLKIRAEIQYASVKQTELKTQWDR